MDNYDSDKEWIYSHFDYIIIADASSEPTFQSVSVNEIFMEQVNDTFSADILSRLNEVEGLPLFKYYKGMLPGTVYKSQQIVVPLVLQSIILHMSYYSKTAGHPGGRKL